MVELLVVMGIILINIIYDVIVYMTHSDISYMILLILFSLGSYSTYRNHESRRRKTQRQRIKELYLNIATVISITLGYILLKVVGWANIYTTIIYYLVIIAAIILYINRRDTQVRESRDK
ncbi:hypothetical protein [Mammaliicoccus sciuri]|uniref:hypothetical protein n=1 Tax=Mammaliicoccus sciuri TaxID=1296 RepID=UPI0021CEB105|nr:hypothetical protein [Mammaliicoccus sciuri]UXV29510.1 hypothetical protein MUA76_00430 [Mammaliicoccus sciuri]